MAQLECAVVTCSYNKEGKCCKGDIMVGGSHARSSEGTFCESYRNCNDNHYTSSLDHPCSIISIDCDAVNCKNNSGYKCYALNVAMMGSNAKTCKDTSCITFEEKQR